MTKIRAVCVGIDLYEFEVKRNILSGWETVYGGCYPIRVSSKHITEAKIKILERLGVL